MRVQIPFRALRGGSLKVKPQLEKENPGSKKHLSGFLKKPGNAGSNPEHRFNMNSTIPAWFNGRAFGRYTMVAGLTSVPAIGIVGSQQKT